LGMASSFIASGRLGLSIAVISYCESMRISVTSDTGVCKEPEVLAEEFEAAIHGYINFAKSSLNPED